MHEISIDSTKRYEKSVKLLRDGELLSEKFGDIDIVASIKQLLVENNLEVGDIKKFKANPGPGSFTGIKLGITIANVLNWSRDLEGFQDPEYGAEPNISVRKNSRV